MPSKFKPTRDRKHRHRQREREQNAVDSNTLQIIAPSQSEREERRQRLKQELRAGLPKVSSKKQKRLDKYIENKLKKDENSALLQKLSHSTFDTSKLQSSKNLGKRKHSEYLADLGEGQHRVRRDRDSDSDSDVSSDEDLMPGLSQPGTSPTVKLPAQQNLGSVAQLRSSFALGSGLKQPLAIGADGLPVLKVRERQTKPKLAATDVPDELPWEGFDSESGESQEEDTTSENVDSSAEGSAEEGSSDEDAETDMSEGEVSDEETDENDEPAEASRRPKVRQSAFKAWASQQINDSLGFTPSSTVTQNFTQTIRSTESNGTKSEVQKFPIPVIDNVSTRKSFSVSVNRSTETQEARLKLPIVAEEQKIMEAVQNNSSIIVWGATGSGKTTQVPQFLFEAGYGNRDSPNPGLIGVTQPRRVAAVSMAKRVGDELTEHRSKVSYQIRFESTASPYTAIKFMTDGILLREISQDFALTKYSVIVVDEAHERSVNTDLLIGMLSRIVDLRKKMSAENELINPLQLIIMSATLRTSDFLQNANLFRNGAPPLVEAEGRQYQVTTHFARRTERDYLEEAFRKVSRGHRKLPPGGMLVFLTGQNEIKALLEKLSKALKSTLSNLGDARVQITASEAPLEAEDLELGGFNDGSMQDEEGDVKFIGLDDEDEDEDFDVENAEDAQPSSSVHLLPLYSQLPTKEQLRVFETPPEGSRMIVLATNVAETSLTIPGIRYVFDCGRSKERVYDPVTGVQRFQIDWISKASAEQRAGRAGRTGPGHCYRLYSSAVYERDFPEHSEPEILRTPLESVVLQLKAMGIDNVLKFPFPTPPDQISLAKAERLLKNLGALGSDDGVTALGRNVSIYPLSPRFGKMLAIGSQHGCLPYVIAAVAGLAVGDIFVPENELDLKPVEQAEGETYTNEDRLEDTAREQRKKAYHKAQFLFTKQDRTSDALKTLAAVCAFAYTNEPEEFCEKMFLRSRAMKEASQLRMQLADIVKANHPTLLNAHQPRLAEPSSTQLKALKQIVAAGFIDQIAIRADLAANPPDIGRKPKRAIDVPYLTLFPVQLGRPMNTEEKAVFLHPSSVLSRQSPRDLPQYLVYSHLQRAAPSTVGGGKVPKIRMMPLTAVSGVQISALAHGTPLIQYGKPLGKIESLGGSPEKRECWIIPSLVGEGGSLGWPLPAKKVIQVKDLKAGWVIDKFVT